MIWIIARKEILLNLLSLRFTLTFLLVVSLFIASGFVFVGKYEIEISEYRRETNKDLSEFSKHADHLNSIPYYRQTLYRRPKVLGLCAEGFERSLPNQFKVDAFSVYLPEIKTRANFLLPRFADVDWVFIISFVLSFVALLLTYDSFSGERENGTLRLLMSHPVPRESVVIGKYVGAFLTLMISLLLGVLLNLLIIHASDLISFGGGAWMKVVAVLLLSLVYLSIFILLGILVSSRTERSATSMVVLLFLWVGLVILIPSCGRIVSEKFRTVPDRMEIDRRIQEARQDIWENGDRYGKNAGNWGGDPHADWVNPPARARLYAAITDSRNRIFEHYFHQIVEQVQLGRNVTRISPTAIYQSASERIVGMGVLRLRDLYRQLKRYKETLRAFILDTDREDPESFHLLIEGRGHRSTLSQQPVDFNVVPKFEERDIPPVETLRYAIWDLGLLVLFNLLLFMGVYVSFLRCEVR